MNQNIEAMIVAAAEFSGWSFAYLDDGYGEPGWWGLMGSVFDADGLETGLFPTLGEAARAALSLSPPR